MAGKKIKIRIIINFCAVQRHIPSIAGHIDQEELGASHLQHRPVVNNQKLSAKLESQISNLIFPNIEE